MFLEIHNSNEDSITYKYVTEPIDIRRRLVKSLKKKLESENQYDSLLELLGNIEDKMRLTISRRPAFYWYHICRRIAPGLHPDLGLRTDEGVLIQVRSHVEQAILKFGSLTNKDGFARSDTVDFSTILGGMLNELLIDNKRLLSLYKENLIKTPQLVLTDFSEEDIADIYHLHGLAYQYWYVTAKLRAYGKGVEIRVLENGDLLEQRSDEQDALICSFDERAEHYESSSIIKNNFVTNVGTFVRTENVKPHQVIYTAALNAQSYTAERLGLTGIDKNFVPNYLPFFFDSDSFYESHKYLSSYFEKKVGFGLLEFCQVSKIFSMYLMTNSHDNLTKNNSGLFFYLRYQRAYKFIDATLTELKQNILKFFEEERKNGHLLKSNAEKQIDTIIDFLTLDEKKQSTIGLWTHGPKFVIIKFGDSYFYDISAWFQIFRNLFFGLKNYDANSEKGVKFEYTFSEYAQSKSFDVVMQSRKIRSNEGKREVDVAIRIKDSLFVFECRAFERPLNFDLGNQKVINSRISDFKDKLKQVDTLVDFIKKNKCGENYDFSWAKEIYGAVVSPYTEWIWSLEKNLWTNTSTFPRIMSATEAINYLANVRDTMLRENT